MFNVLPLITSLNFKLYLLPPNYPKSLPGTSGIQASRPTTSSMSTNRPIYLDSDSSSLSSSGQITPVTIIPDRPSSSHEIADFRKALFNALTPTEPKTDQLKAKKKRLTFNNVALTSEDAMKQIKESEDNIQENKNNKIKRAQAKEGLKEKVTFKNGAQKRKGKVLKCPLKNKIKTLNKKRMHTLSASESSTEDESFVSDSSDSDLILSDLSLGENSFSSKTKQPLSDGPEVIKLPALKAGDYVAAVYEGEWFLATVFGTPIVKGDGGHTYYNLSFAQIKDQNKFIWPEKQDSNLTLEDYIL